MECFSFAAMAQVTLEHFLQGRLEVVARDALEDLPPDGLSFPKAAADEDVIAVHRFAGDFDLRAEQPDVAHVVLRAGIRAAGEVDVDRLIELEPLVEIVGEFQRVTLGVRGGELAIGASRAGPYFEEITIIKRAAATPAIVGIMN